MSLKVDMKADEPRQPPLTTLTKPNGTAGSTRPRHPLSDCCPAQPDRLAASAAAARSPCAGICLFLLSCSALTLKQMIGKSIGWYVKNPGAELPPPGPRPQITVTHQERKEEKRIHSRPTGAGQVESSHGENRHGSMFSFIWLVEVSGPIVRVCTRTHIYTGANSDSV